MLLAVAAMFSAASLPAADRSTEVPGARDYFDELLENESAAVKRTCELGPRQSPVRFGVFASGGGRSGLEIQYTGDNLPQGITGVEASPSNPNSTIPQYARFHYPLYHNGHSVTLLMNTAAWAPVKAAGTAQWGQQYNNPRDWRYFATRDANGRPAKPMENISRAGNNAISVDGRQFWLQQLHFHRPAEHMWDGTRYPMEMHLVHSVADNFRQAGPGAQNTVVIAVFLDLQARDNPVFSPIFDAMQATTRPGLTAPVHHESFRPIHLLPSGGRIARYSGSLTTPPCSEDVIWFVMANPQRISQAQYDRFARAISVNARPLRDDPWPAARPRPTLY